MEKTKAFIEERNVSCSNKLQTERTATTQVTWIIYTLTALSHLGILSCGYEMGISSGAMLTLEKVMILSPLWKQLIIIGALPSAILTLLIGSHLSDFLGRKKVIMAASCCYVLGSLISGLAVSKTMLLIGRLFTGVALGKYTVCFFLIFFLTFTI